MQDTNIADLIATDIDEEGPNNEIHFELLHATNIESKKDYKEMFKLDYTVSKESHWWVDKRHKRARLMAVKDLKNHYGKYKITMKVSVKG